MEECYENGYDYLSLGVFTYKKKSTQKIDNGVSEGEIYSTIDIYTWTKSYLNTMVVILINERKDGDYRVHYEWKL